MIMPSHHSSTCCPVLDYNFGSACSVHYNSVADSGTNGESLYVSAELSLFSIDFSLVNKVSVPLCYDGEEEAADEEAADEEAANDGGRRLEEYECPNDGSYAFSVQYVLPTAGKETTSWLASGWTGTGVVQMYAQANDQMLIGECILTLSTFVTKEDTSSLLSTPSAAATAGIILAVVLAAILMCFYCYCCVKSRKSRKESLEEGDDVTSNFRRMDEDGVSKPSTIHIDAASQAKSKASAAEMI
jgi:hypothetical protein